jgi:hypothetical protein
MRNLDTLRPEELIRDYGALNKDLMDAGVTNYRARRLIKTIEPNDLSRKGAVEIPLFGLPPVVALVPVSEVARRYLAHGVYLRDSRLRGQLRLRATHLGWSDEGTVQVVRPIKRRWRIGSYKAIKTLGLATEAAVRGEPDVDTWSGPATLVELGPPQPLDLRLGFAPKPKGGADAIPGVWHRLLADLLAAANSGGTLLDVPSL